MRVGFIGLGHMGADMAASLIRAGHDVTVWNRTRSKAEPLADSGTPGPAEREPANVE